MWQLHRMLDKNRSAAFAGELFESSSRSLIVAVTAVYMGWHLFDVGKETWLITALFLPLAAAAYFLVRRHFFVAQFVWLATLLATITLTLTIYQIPGIAFLYALLPIIAMLALGWPAALAAEMIVALLLAWLVRSELITGIQAYLVLLGGLLLGITGWTSTRTLFTLLQWSLTSWEEAQKSARAAQEHRAGLLELNIQLDRANHQLDRANAALLAAWRVADEAERFKAEFVTNVSHEMRTPLNLIIGFSQMMVTAPESYGGVQLPGAYRSDLHTVYRSAQHMLALVDDVIDMARIDAGKIPLVKYEVQLGSLVQEAADIIRGYILAKGLELRLKVADGLPPVWVDRQRIRQVLLNLLTNAARHTQQGSITIEAHCQGDSALVRVVDTGPGIAPENLQWIFTQFHTTEQASSEWHSGTGLGLPISKQFVTLHGGVMGAGSELGRGSCFWFTLPFHHDLLEAEATGHADRLRPVVQGAASARAVVVVHPTPDEVTLLLKRHLDNYEVIGAANWAEAARLAEDAKPVAFVCDRALPDGLPDELLNLNLPLIRCPLPKASLTAPNLGVKAFLVKPVARHELLDAVDRVQRKIDRVLLVDDDPAVTRMFRRMLTGRIAPRNCFEATDGAEALELLRSQKPDLVVLDLVMPTVDGYSVLEQMAKDPDLADIPVILASATGRDSYDLQVSGEITIAQGRGFELGEMLSILQSTLDSLSPGWVRFQSSALAFRAAQPA
jgi:signal transduction histidine kinase/CheY-like chemotaxis protein